jgi:hypothetical protein
LTRTDCDCEACRSACVHRPGWFAPGEATRAAAYLGLTLEQFFARSLIIDWYDDLDGEDVELLAPATERQVPGTRAGFEDPWHPSRCRLLTDRGCGLPFELRPAECRRYYGCDPSTWSSEGRSPDLAASWRERPEELEQLRF